jgi:putative protein-disulfide isomerase
MEPQIEITEFTDPYCTWCWGSEPVLRHALEAYGDRISLRFVMGGLVEDRTTFYDPANGIGGEQWEQQIAAHWVEASGRHGMPVDMAHYERVLGMPSTYPANIAYEAAKLQDPAHADRYLRRLREAAAIEGQAIHEPEVLAGLAAEMGLERARFERDFSGAAVEAFAADRATCAQYGVRGFPAFLVRVGEREQTLPGYRGFSQFAGLIDLLAGYPVARRTLEFRDEVVLGFVDKYGSAAPREVAEVFEVADEAADAALQRLTAAGLVECLQVETGRFYRALKGEGFCDAATGMCG